MKEKWTAPKNEGFGFGLKPEKLPTETAIRWAFEKRERFLNNAARLSLLLAPIRMKKDRKIIEFLYGKYSVTVEELFQLTESESLLKDNPPNEALRKRIERLNKHFRKEGLPLAIMKERGGRDMRDMERVWLDVLP